MSNLNKTMTDMQEMMKSAQAMFAVGPAAGSQSAHFWQAQDMILSEFETLSSAWFKRRHEGTRTAMETARRLVEEAAGNPAAAMGILADWQSHSMERLAADAKDCTTMMTNCAEAMVNNEIEAVEETMETAKKSMKTAKSSPV